MLNFEITPSSVMTKEVFFATVFAIIIFIVVPIALAILEYRITKKQKRHGLYLVLGVIATALLLGVWSLFVGLLLLIIYWVASSPRKSRGHTGAYDN